MAIKKFDEDIYYKLYRVNKLKKLYKWETVNES